MRDNDSIEEVMHVMDHDHILFFTSDGIVRSLRAFQLPQGSRTSGGTPITQASSYSDSRLSQGHAFHNPKSDDSQIASRKVTGPACLSLHYVAQSAVPRSLVLLLERLAKSCKLEPFA